MLKLRGRIKSDPAKYEDSKRKEGERYNARKAAGKIKSVKDMTPREQRRMRKEWRVEFNNRYKKKKESRQLETFLDEHTPPNSPDVPDRFEEENVIQDDMPRKTSPEIIVPTRQSVSRQFLTGEKLKKKNRKKLNGKIKQLESSLKKSEMRARKYKKRYYRLQAAKNDDEESPEKQEVEKILSSFSATKNVKKGLGFGEALFCQVKSNLTVSRLKVRRRKGSSWNT
nr:unnamed protein product [Callosobruchus analis]